MRWEEAVFVVIVIVVASASYWKVHYLGIEYTVRLKNQKSKRSEKQCSSTVRIETMYPVYNISYIGPD